MQNSSELNPKELTQLEKLGYVALGQLLDAEALTSIRGRIEILLADEQNQAGVELLDSQNIRHAKEEGADRLADLVNKGPEFEACFTHPKLLAGMRHVLGNDCKLSSLNYRAARPDGGEQKLHVDWHEAITPPSFLVCNSIWLLDDFTEENGATRLVPGSHLRGKTPEQELEDPWATHPDEVLVTGEAGSVFLFNAHLWHGGTRNRSARQRRAIHSYFCRHDQPQQTNQLELLTE
ncbi:MAG: phytanoyl-CoA dioxygenase family protein, partial [Planctomycetota bacterium]